MTALPRSGATIVAATVLVLLAVAVGLLAVQRPHRPADAAAPASTVAPSPTADPPPTAAPVVTPRTSPHGRPSGSAWRAAVAARLAGSAAFLAANAHRPRPAVVLDIDNTALQSHYHHGAATPAVLGFARAAARSGYAVLFATGRTTAPDSSTRGLRAVGYPVDGMCTRHDGQSLPEEKAACRARWTRAGYTIVATVGNRRTDFEGGDTGRQYVLPNYGFLT